MRGNLRFIVFWFVIVLIFFYPIFLGLVPSPLDTIVGLYHPFKDVVWNGLTAGVPFKNFLITDPVRQQIPWRFLAIEGLQNGELFRWNPYSFSGTPLTANIQAGTFYPLNILFIFMPFLTAWSILIISTSFLSGIFMFVYLRFIKLGSISSIIGSLAFSFSGFMIAWLEWGTVGQVLLWLPLIMYLKEKIISKVTIPLLIMLCFSEVSLLLAGHLQTSIYIVIFTSLYLVVRIFQTSYRNDKKQFLKATIKKFAPFLINGIVVSCIVFPQYYDFFRLLVLSARDYDLPNWQISSWFFPVQNFIQFIAPDFFGNPSTLNYWGEWNYGEFVGYIGIIPLFFLIIGFLFSKNDLSKFYKISAVALIVLMIKNPLSEIPFTLSLPFLGSAQPSRMLSLLVFCFSVLSAFGIEYFILNKEKRITKSLLIPSGLVLLIVSLLWLSVYFGKDVFPPGLYDSIGVVSKRNLILPTALVFISFITIYAYFFKKIRLFLFILILITFLDLFRFGHKFISFSRREYFYPNTKVISFLKDQQRPFRIMTLDRRILAPNFSIMYKLEDVAGYDPVYLKRYSQLVNSWQQNAPTIIPGNFNRIVTPDRYDSFISSLLNVKYVISLSDITSDDYVKVFSEGETRVYENQKTYPRAFLVNTIFKARNDEDEMNLLFTHQDRLSSSATSQEDIDIDDQPLENGETAEVISFDENHITIQTNTKFTRLLVLSDIYYPGWSVAIDDSPAEINQVDYLLRGVVVPSGEHNITFTYNGFIVLK